MKGVITVEGLVTTYKPYITIKESRLREIWELHYKKEYTFEECIKHLVETGEYKHIE